MHIEYRICVDYKIYYKKTLDTDVSNCLWLGAILDNVDHNYWQLTKIQIKFAKINEN